MTPEEPESAAPSPEAVDAALRAFWRGSPDAVDALAPEEEPRASLGAAFAHLYEATPTESPPEMITGEYVIVREIGRGGMGVVYEARQETTGRAVALKVMLHRSASDPTHVKLFQREVRTLARLKHPCIATLYDAGQTESGQQYFAMELVRGRPLREYCQSLQNPESQGRLLGLFGEICEGISYAHQRGVIHRDLKPSNIVIDEDGRPKILDFGLARLVDPDGELLSNVTEAGRLLGTLAYMSPEQARGEADAVDVRSDVYTLGIILYELLTGARPYEVKTSAWTEAIRTISEMPVTRPSTVKAGLRGDIETIVLKALAKDPAERYASAAAFAQDIDRYLTNLPILARPPNGLYQLRKLIVRHKTPAALTAALFLLVAAFAIVFGVQKGQVARQRDEAKAQALRAQRISDYVTNMLQSVDPKSVGASVSVKDLLDRAAADLESELASDPETRASMHETLARGYLTLEAYAPCEAHARKALELRRQLSGEHNAAYASALHLVGVAMCRNESPESAEKVLREAYDLRLALLGPQDPAIAESLEALADIYFRRNQYPEAERLFRNAIELWRKADGQRLRLAAAMDGYSVMLTAAGRYAEAEPQLAEALAIRRQVYGDDHLDVARTLTDLGEIYSQWGQYDKAESMHREQVRILKKLFPEGHVKLSHAYSDLATVLAAKGAYVEAEPLFKQSVEMEERFGNDHASLTRNNYATFLRDQGRFKEAEPLSHSVYQNWGGWSKAHHRAQGYACQNWAAALFELGEFDQAKKLYDDAEVCWRALFGNRHPKMTNALIGMGRIAEIRGDQVTAERLYREAFDIRRDVLGPTHPETAAAQVFLAGVLPPDDAETMRLCDAALESLRKRWGSTHSEVAWTLGRLAVIQRARGDTTASEYSLGEAIDIERKLPRSRHPNLAACLVERGEILLERGDVQAAQPLFQEALDIQNERFAATDERISRTKRDLDRCRRSISKS